NTRLSQILSLFLGLRLRPISPFRVSCELNDISRARKLCGRHLLQEIVKLCGSVNWSHIEEEKPFTQLLSQASEKVETFIPDRLESSQTTFPVWRRATNPGKNLNQRHVFSSLPTCLLRQEIFSSSQDISPYIHEIVEFQKKNTNKIKTLSNLFWGNHPQRKHRGYSEKCCPKGCTKRTYYCIDFL
uniref:Insulin-like domain-containing protein n=1 Tax=Monodon monoceros TaxID=40151 RepID=A0A8C6C9I6_MONMO